MIVGTLLLSVTSVSADQQFNRMVQMEKREQPAVPAQGAPDVERDVIRKPNLEYKSEKLPDPFRKQFEEVAAAAEAPVSREEGYSNELSAELRDSFAIQGIIWGGRFPQAIMNNKVVKVGDEVMGARIIEINPNGISVLFEDRVYNVTLSTLDKLLEGSKGGEDEK